MIIQIHNKLQNPPNSVSEERLTNFVRRRERFDGRSLISLISLRYAVSVWRIRIILIRMQIRIQDQKNSLQNRIQTELWYGSGSRQNDTDPGPDPGKKGSRKILIKTLISHVFLFILLNYPFSINNHLN